MIDTDEEDFDEDVFGLSSGDEDDDVGSPPPPPEKKPPSNNVLKFRRELGLDLDANSDEKPPTQQPVQPVKRIETLASKLKKNVPPPEVVVFASKPSSSRAKGSSKKGKEISDRREEDKPADLKTLKNDVYRFGVKGFEKSKRESAMVDLLCSLGARPDKNPHKNYKVLKAERKAEKEAAIKAKREGTHFGSTLAPRAGTARNKAAAKRARRKDRNKVAGFDVQPGKFRDGVQFVKPKDLKMGSKKN